MSHAFHHGALQLVLEQQKLVAFIINEGWLLVRRKDYIDVFIEDQPFNSVEVLFNLKTQVKNIALKCFFFRVVICLVMISENHCTSVGKDDT